MSGLPDQAVSPPARRPHWVALAVLLVLCGAVGLRWYSDRYGTRPTDRVDAAWHRVDLNRASRTELMQVPNVGPAMAERIVSHREANGQFRNLDDLRAIHGIGPATLDKLRPWVTIVGGEEPPAEPDRLMRKPTPKGVLKPGAAGGLINVNTATADELQRLPNIGPAMAGRIIAEREKRPFASVAELRRVSGIGPKRLEALRDLVTVEQVHE